MKKIVFISVFALLFCTFGTFVHGQTPSYLQKITPVVSAKNQNYKYIKAKSFTKVPLRGDESVSNNSSYYKPVHKLKPKTNTNTAKRTGVQSMTSEQIGSTTYDLQTNNSVAKRLILHPNGTMTATWTMSQSTASTFSDRGTGYNYYNGSNWGPLPSIRIEKDRNGWPNPFTNLAGNENVLTHLAGATNKDGLNQAFRATMGTGTWANVLTCTGNNFPTCDTGATWPRVAYSGNYVHVISSRLGGNWYGLVGGLAYLRSTDGGATWETPKLITGMDSNSFTRLGGDSYAIDAHDSTVAFVCGSFQPTLFKSTDNGSTWKMKVLQPISNPLYSGDTLELLDSVVSTDECYALLVDNNNIVHVWYGKNIITDNDIAKGWSYYPWNMGIMYWNETMTGTPVLIEETVPVDDNGDGTITWNSTGLAASIYFPNGVSMASAGTNANGDIFLTYSAVVENTSHTGDALGYHFRNLFVTASHDGGKSWVQPINLTKEEFFNGDEYQFAEVVYANLAKNSDSLLHITYQRDDLPGYSLYTPTGGDAHPIVDNLINYISVPTCFLSAQVSKSQYILCPGASATFQASGGVSFAWSPGKYLSDSTISNPVFVPDSSLLGYRVNFQVMTTDANGCSSYANIKAYVNNLDSLVFAGFDQVIKKGQKYQLEATPGADTYSWSPTTGLSDPNVFNPIASPDSTTTYVVIVTSGGCYGSDTVTITVDTTVSLLNKHIFENNNVKLYQNAPNPFGYSTTFGLELYKSTQIDLSVSNIMGQKVATIAKGKYGMGTYFYDISKKELNLKSGIYFYTLRTGSQIITKKMIVN